MLTDTHAHLDFPDFAGEVPALIARAAAAGVKRIITIGTDVEGSRRAIKLAEEHPEVWAAVGIHPNNASEAADSSLTELRALASHPRVVAIGEIGLDYFRLPGSKGGTPGEDLIEKARQAAIFRAQLDLASDLGLNVVIHQRASWDDTLAMLTPYSERLRAVYHCFGEPVERANAVVALGHLISFTGIVTFKNAAALHHTAASVPSGSFMFETDCPYLAPVPHRGQRCEPAWTQFTAERVAALRGVTLEQVATEAERTANGFFRIGEG